MSTNNTTRRALAIGAATALAGAAAAPGVAANESAVIEHVQVRVDWLVQEEHEGYSEGFHDNRPIRREGRGGTTQAIVRNHGDSPLALETVRIDGIHAEELRNRRQLVWWAMRPARVEPGAYGLVTVRWRREPPTGELALDFTNGTTVATRLDPAAQTPPFRLQSVGFHENRQWVVLYFETRPGDPLELRHLDWNGQRLEAGGATPAPEPPPGGGPSLHWLQRNSKRGQAVALVVCEEPLTPGTDHVYIRAEDDAGNVFAYVIKVQDGGYPLGTYDWPQGLDLPALAKAGANAIAGHHRFPTGMLDQMAALDMQCIQYVNHGTATLTTRVPEPELADHPAIRTLLPTDEPDVADYFHWDRLPKDEPRPPWAERVGHFAQDVVKSAELIVGANPRLNAAILVNMTIKPWNWYEYGETTDVLFQNNYALTHGAKIGIIPTVQREAMSAAAPNPVIHVYDNCWQEQEGRGINRPKTAGEQRRLMYYALGQGARGLIGWWNVSAPNGPNRRYHAIREFPDQWSAQADVYQEAGFVEPLLAIAYPARLRVAATPALHCAPLLAGPRAMLVVLVNERLDYSGGHSLSTPARNVVATVEPPSWLVPAAVYRVVPGGVEPLAFAAAPEGLRIQVGDLHDAGMLLLVAAAEDVAQLESRWHSRQNLLAARLLEVERQQFRAAGLEQAIAYDLRLNRTAARREASQLPHTYQATVEDFANPEEVQHNSINWYFKEPSEQTAGVYWETDFPVGASTLAFQSHAWGQPLEVTLHDGAGEPLAAAAGTAASRRTGGFTLVDIHLSAPGRFRLQVAQHGPGGERGGRVSRFGWVLPGIAAADLARNPPPPSLEPAAE